MSKVNIDLKRYGKWLLLFVSLILNIVFLASRRSSNDVFSPLLFPQDAVYPTFFKSGSNSTENFVQGFSCSDEQKNRQEEFHKEFLEKEGFGCPNPIVFLPFLKAIWRERGEKTLVFFNVGANKGYGIAEWLGVMASSLGITPESWGKDYLTTKHSDEFEANRLCGVCSNCNHKISTVASFTPSWSGKDLKIIAAEPVPSNVKLLLELKRVARKVPGLVVLPVGLSDSGGSAFIENAKMGFEDAGLKYVKENENYVQVNVTTVDEVAAVLQLDQIHWLRIDTDGFDGKVIRGARGMLTDRRVSVLEFEYASMWPADEGLRNTVDFLDTMEFDCYLMTKRKILRITRCFSPALETRKWSSPNVICASRRDPAISNYFLTLSLLEFEP